MSYKFNIIKGERVKKKELKKDFSYVVENKVWIRLLWQTGFNWNARWAAFSFR